MQICPLRYVLYLYSSIDNGIEYGSVKKHGWQRVVNICEVIMYAQYINCIRLQYF